MARIGFIGAGQMASAIIAGLRDLNHTILISGKDPDKTQSTAKNLGVTAVLSNQSLIEQSDYLILAAKPQQLTQFLGQLDFLDKPIISLAAGITIEQLHQLTKSSAIIRVMPNLNVKIKGSTSGLCASASTDDTTIAFVKALFEHFGSVYRLDEKDFSIFTAIAGSSPAYGLLFIEAMSRAALSHGLPKDLATQIVADSLEQTAKHLRVSHQHPWEMIDAISSPGGVTVAGIRSLEADNFQATIARSIDASLAKDSKLSN